MMKRKLHQATVLSNKKTGVYCHIELDVSDSIHCEPGQFAMLRGPWRDIPFWSRAFSFFDAPPRLSFLIKIVGLGTERLASLRPGDVIHLNGPLGKGFNIPSVVGRPVLVAGGTGIAPIHFLASVLKHSNHLDPLILYGGKTKHDLLALQQCMAEFETIAMTEDGSYGTKGFATDPLEQIIGSSTASVVYACGPITMLHEIRSITLKNNIRCEMSFETIMACGMGFCLGCAMPSFDGNYLCLCQDGPVLEPSVLDWSRM